MGSKNKNKQPVNESSSLPIHGHRKEIIETIKSNPTTILIGETASGKTTQIPQFLLPMLQPHLCIAVTQPRRISAVSLAKRVADEMHSQLGQTVGYSVRFDSQTSRNTRIKFLTDGMLLREALDDPLLSKYGIIVLDEVHERTVRTDMLFGIVKRIQEKRKELKIIVMSATLDPSQFEKFFGNTGLVYVQGRQFPVEVYATEEPQKDYVEAAFCTVLQIHREETKGDILVFLSGQEEIEAMCELFEGVENLVALPLYASLTLEQQQKVFEKIEKRKVVLATNVAETSITIPGIRYVVDSGVAKIRAFHSKTGLESLLVHPISQSNAWQRTGRAGREGPGACYRLYTDDSMRKLPQLPVPEIKRIHLSAMLLQLKAYGIDDVSSFPYIDTPPQTAVLKGLHELMFLGAVNAQGQLSELGHQMAKLPLSPSHAKALLASRNYNCTLDTIRAISMMNVEEVFLKSEERKWKSFVDISGDHVTLANILSAFMEEKKEQRHWCKEYALSFKGLKMAQNIYLQLLGLCRKSGLFTVEQLQSKNESESVLLSLLEGLGQNVAVFHSNCYNTFQKQSAFIHPSSILFNNKSAVVIFDEIVVTSKVWLRRVSKIEISWLQKQ